MWYRTKINVCRECGNPRTIPIGDGVAGVCVNFEGTVGYFLYLFREDQRIGVDRNLKVMYMVSERVYRGLRASP